MGRGPIYWRPKPLTRRPYAVLARVSSGYPPPEGTLSTRYSPVRHSLTEVRAFDLHVLSLPLAFALSQDQTLQFDLLISLLTRSQPILNPEELFMVRLLM